MGQLLAHRTLWQDPVCPAYLALHPNPYNGNRQLATLAPCELAAVTWERLPANMQALIDDAIRRGNIPGLLAMRAADPPIELPHAADVLAFRHRAGVDHDASC
ncbi:hypothetical protein AB0J72_22895 [Dactylosporangium sp. NPDC049742]|uniref:hypothetical protein n=1 Tax=Dactylosporangium sp. NPDC049742 TaxID=3154737 RepID=UPI003426E552